MGNKAVDRGVDGMATARTAKVATQHDLGQLFAKFLANRGTEPQLDFPTEEVLPHQTAGLLAIDPRSALLEAVEAADYLLDAKSAARLQLSSLKAPVGWGSVIRAHDPMLAVPLCLGNFPQMVRDVAPFLDTNSFATLRPRTARPADADEVFEWGRQMLAKGQMAEALFAAAVLRVARQFDATDELLTKIESGWKDAPAGLVVNERAALAWHRGQGEDAAKLWAAHPQQSSPAILLNRGMAALFADKPREAAGLLMKAIGGLPDKSAWHHLARFYLVAAGNAAAAA
jgi:hypothetical protein